MSAVSLTRNLLFRPSLTPLQLQQWSPVEFFSNKKTQNHNTVKNTPGATSPEGRYQVEEYYSYNPQSFYDLQICMEKYRLEQPKPQTRDSINS